MKYDKERPRNKAVVRESSSTYDETGEMKRLTIDVSADLHAAIKSQCARRGLKMADAIRALLQAEFGGG